MDELISRQDVIDITWEEPSYTDPLNILAEIRDRIKTLPSAQPEVIRCKDCKWWTKQEDSLQGRCVLLQMYPTGGWFCGSAQREVTE